MVLVGLRRGVNWWSRETHIVGPVKWRLTLSTRLRLGLLRRRTTVAIVSGRCIRRRSRCRVGHAGWWSELVAT
jgi:hypothetical protein